MLHSLMTHLVTWIYQHPYWAGLALFLLSAAESITIIGSFIPGTVVMVAIGIFIGANLLPYWPMVAWATTGALIGDALNFTLGYYLKDNIGKVWPFKTRKHWLSKSQNFFKKHGGKSIFFARFIGPLRAFAPIIFGAMRIPAGKFYLIDTLSAFVWATVYLLPGVLLGKASLELSPDISEHLFRFVFLTLIIVIVGVWVIRLLILHINDVVKNALSCLWTIMKENPSFSLVCRLFRHYKTDHPRGQLGTVFVLLLVSLAFICLVINVLTNGILLTNYDHQLYHLIESFRMHWLDHLMPTITLLGQKEILSISFLAVLIWLCYQRCWHAAIFWLGAFLLGLGGAYYLKAIIHAHRPSLWFETVDGFSFPSGHVVMATLLYGGFAYLAAGYLSLKIRSVVYASAISLTVVVAFSRLYLGVHWMSDILGSVFFAWACLLFMALFYQRHRRRDIKAKTILPFLLILQIVSSWVYFHYHHEQMARDYLISPSEQIVNADTWWKEGYPATSMMASNRFGTPKSLLNIQWAGEDAQIISLLNTQGWHSALEPHNWIAEIQHPDEKTPSINLHVKIRFFEDKKPKIIFYKALNKPHTFMVLQLWETGVRMDSSSLKLFAGALSFNSDTEKPEVIFSDLRLTTEFLQSLNDKVETRVIATPIGLPSQTAINDMSVILIQPIS